MRDDLQTRSLRIVRRAPLPPTPAYVPTLDPLQSRLDALKRAGGRRKTRSRKTLKRKYKYRR